MKIFIAKLPYQFQEADITELFTPYGDVSSVNLIMDRETGRSKCYAFVEMPDDEQAINAIANLDQKQVQDKEIAVSQAKEREKPAGGGFRGGNGGGYRGGNGGGGYRGGNSGGGYRGGNNSGGGGYRDRNSGGGNSSGYRDRNSGSGNDRYSDKRDSGGYRDKGKFDNNDDY